MLYPRLHTLVTICILTIFSAAAWAGDEYPLRADFPEVVPITTEDLAARFEAGDVVVVDVRSQFEYDTIHINQALHLPVAKKTFLQDLEEIRPKDGAAPFAFYCNGTTCAKSYKAARQATEAGFQGCFVYDAGVFAWTKRFPQWATLLGKSPADSDQIISKAALKERCLDFAQFEAKAQSSDAVVIDIRDPMQRAVRLELGKTRNIPLDRIDSFLDKDANKAKTLLIYDAVGKQVRWLQYHLEAKGYSHYAFLDGGVRKAIGDKKHY